MTNQEKDRPIIVRAVKARAVTPPFKRPPASASGPIPAAALVLIDIETDAGLTGRSYVFTFTTGMLKPVVEAVRALGDLIKGEAVAPLAIDAAVRSRLKLLDTPGLLGIALNGIDQALWDILAQSRDLPLAVLLGGTLRPARAYNSCGLWIQSPDTVADDAEKLVAEGNFSAVKMRARPSRFCAGPGRRACGEEAHRRGHHADERFQPEPELDEGIPRGRALDHEGLYWIEEPIRHDDYAGSAKICAEVKTPIQIGENLLTTFEMERNRRGRSTS